MAAKDKEVKVGSIVAFNALPTATWFDVLAIEGHFVMTVREHGTNYAEQHMDKSLVKQIRSK